MPNNQDKTEDTKSAHSQTQEKPTANMDATNRNPGGPTNMPGRMENEKGAAKQDGARSPEGIKPNDQKPNKGI